MNSCDKNDDVDAAMSDLTGTWTVISFDDHQNSTQIFKTEDNTWTQYNNGDISLSFTKQDSKGHGGISGTNVTNSFSANYSIDRKGKISIDNLISTLVNEPAWGRMFHVFGQAENYAFEDGILMVFYNQNKNSISMERKS